MTIVCAFDLGLNTGWAIIESGQRPRAGSFRIPFGAANLGEIAVYFEAKASEIIRRAKPDVVARASRFINAYSNPHAIGPLFGLSMRLDEIAVRRKIRHVEVAESDARKAFLGKVPRKSRDIKRAVIDACSARGWPAKDDHCCDAIVIGCHVLAILCPEAAHEATPMFRVKSKGRNSRD